MLTVIIPSNDKDQSHISEQLGRGDKIIRFVPTVSSMFRKVHKLINNTQTQYVMVLANADYIPDIEGIKRSLLSNDVCFLQDHFVAFKTCHVKVKAGSSMTRIVNNIMKEFRGKQKVSEIIEKTRSDHEETDTELNTHKEKIRRYVQELERMEMQARSSDLMYGDKDKNPYKNERQYQKEKFLQKERIRKQRDLIRKEEAELEKRKERAEQKKKLIQKEQAKGTKDKNVNKEVQEHILSTYKDFPNRFGKSKRQQVVRKKK